MSELPNPLGLPPFPPANLKAGWRRSSRQAAEDPDPARSRNTSPQSRPFTDYDKVDHKTRAEPRRAMQRLHEHYPDDAEAAIFYALASTRRSISTTRTSPSSSRPAAIRTKKRNRGSPIIPHCTYHDPQATTFRRRAAM